MKLHGSFLILRAAVKIFANVWRFDSMYRHTKEIVRNVGIGLAASTAVAAIGVGVAKSQNRQGRQIRRTAVRAIHTVGNIVNGLEKMVR